MADGRLQLPRYATNTGLPLAGPIQVCGNIEVFFFVSKKIPENCETGAAKTCLKWCSKNEKFLSTAD